MAKAKQNNYSGESSTGAQRTPRNNLANFFQDTVQGLTEQTRRQALEQFSIVARSIVENPALRRIDKIEMLYDGIDVLAHFIANLAPSSPVEAPELWVNRADRNENPFEFTRRVYGLYLRGGTLSRRDIRRLDFQLNKSLTYWTKSHGSDPTINLKTRSRIVDDLLEVLKGTTELDEVPASAVLKVRPLLRLQSVPGVRKGTRRRQKA